MVNSDIEAGWNVVRVKIGDVSSVDAIKEIVSNTNIVFEDDIDYIFNDIPFVNGITNLYLQIVPLKGVEVLDYGTLDEINSRIAKPLGLSLCPIDVLVAFCLQYPCMLSCGGLFVPVGSHGIYGLSLQKFNGEDKPYSRLITCGWEGNQEALCSDDCPGHLLLVKSV